MTFFEFLKQTKTLQKFKKHCEMRWRQFWCIHDYRVDKMSLRLPMAPVYKCRRCEKWKS